MKTRIGFVSNSSSTSFIVAVRNEPEKCAHCGRSDPDLLELIDQRCGYSCDNEVDSTDFESIKEEVNRQWSEYNEKEKILKEVKEYSEKEGWQIASISISYHDEFLKEIVENMKAAGNLIEFYKVN